MYIGSSTREANNDGKNITKLVIQKVIRFSEAANFFVGIWKRRAWKQ